MAMQTLLASHQVVEKLDQFQNLDFDKKQSSAPVVVVSAIMGSDKVLELVKQHDLKKMSGHDIVLFGADRQAAFSKILDTILSEITKGSSPVIFELFDRINKGVDEADLPNLEKSIEASLKVGMIQRLLEALKLSSVAKRVQNASVEIDKLMTSKSRSIVELTSTMQNDIKTEVDKLIQDSARLTALAKEYRDNIGIFDIYVRAGKQILANGQEDLAKMQKDAEFDPLLKEECKNFQQRLDLFHNQLVKLELILAKAPEELEAIRLGQGASYANIAEVSSSALSEMNDIKSALIRMATSHQNRTVQMMSTQRRSLRENLQQVGNNMLGEVAVSAAEAQGNNRLADAELLKKNAEQLKAISNKVLDATNANQLKFKQARLRLEEVKNLL